MLFIIMVCLIVGSTYLDGQVYRILIVRRHHEGNAAGVLLHGFSHAHVDHSGMERTSTIISSNKIESLT
jgi:hypothetical protein